MVMPSCSRRNQHLLGFGGGLRDTRGRDRFEHLGDRAASVPSAVLHWPASAPAFPCSRPSRGSGRRRLPRDRYSFRHGPGWRRNATGFRSRRPSAMPDGRADHRERRVFQRLVGVLAQADQLLDLVPGRDIGREQREAEIGAGGEIGRPRYRSPAPCILACTSWMVLLSSVRCRHRASSSCW